MTSRRKTPTTQTATFTNADLKNMKAQIRSLENAAAAATEECQRAKQRDLLAKRSTLRTELGILQLDEAKANDTFMSLQTIHLLQNVDAANIIKSRRALTPADTDAVQLGRDEFTAAKEALDIIRMTIARKTKELKTCNESINAMGGH
jgi:hypothetical protein